MSNLITFEDYEQSAKDPAVIIINNSECDNSTEEPYLGFIFGIFIVGAFLYLLK